MTVEEVILPMSVFQKNVLMCFSLVMLMSLYNVDCTTLQADWDGVT